ncbi:MAG TPA: acyltransferase [Pseudolysinimonas sp.]|nr:acyltransferase [Pseudolysinimonas sp.]
MINSALRGFREDIQLAAHHFVFDIVGGSAFSPRALRRAIYNLFGASLRSAPGSEFSFVGRAKNFTVGQSVYFNRQVFVEARAPVTIGDECAFGMQTMIITSHHRLDRDGTWQHKVTGRPVIIGDRVWVGARATILPGAVIESDVIIAAGAVVTGRCASHGVYAGVPARRIRGMPAESTA